jgi:hypothetical protein
MSGLGVGVSVTVGMAVGVAVDLGGVRVAVGNGVVVGIGVAVDLGVRVAIGVAWAVGVSWGGEAGCPQPATMRMAKRATRKRRKWVSFRFIFGSFLPSILAQSQVTVKVC